MDPRSDIHDRLAASLREARKARGLSLDAVAKLSGVSRSMVSQIERGESSPTVATLWNLTQALQVDFAGLLEGGPGAGIEVIHAEFRADHRRKGAEPDHPHPVARRPGRPARGLRSRLRRCRRVGSRTRIRRGAASI